MFGFKRTVKPVAKSEAIAPTELAYATSWGLSYSEWQGSTIEERRDMRDTVTFAPYFNRVKVNA